MATRQEIAKLYVATFNRAADASGLAYWDGTGPVTTGLTDIEDIAAAMLESPEAAALYSGLDREATVIKMYDNLFNRTVDGSDTGVIYWVNGGGSTVDLNLMIKALIDGALGTDKTTINNKATVGTAFADAGLDSVSQAISIMQDVSSDSSSVTEALKVINEVAGNGNLYTLSSDNDIITATAGDDTFEAYLSQNSLAGGVSNTLSSGDKLDGGAGEDSLYAQLVPEFFGVTGNNQIDIQVRTSGIENVEFEARDAGGSSAVSGTDTLPTNAVVTVDAKDMTGVNKIGSSYSDGDLVIENLTTLTDAGEIRHTSAMTITMDHTDNFNSDEDASDLTVYFDEDYLNTTTTTQGSALTVKINNVLNIAEGTNPVENFTGINFTVGTTAVAVDITGSTSYQDVVNAINAQLASQGLTTVSAALGTMESVAFSMNIGTYTTGQIAGTFYPIVITNSGSETLTKGTIDLAQGQTDGDINNTWTQTDATESTNPISINVELEKVGRDGEGGNLIIGGKDQGLDGNTDVDKNDGIQVFNITVKGDSSKPSNLGVIQSTNNALDIVTVASETGTDANNAAALSVTGDSALTAGSTSNTDDANPFGGTLTTFNADNFLGDLYIGQEVRALNIDAFSATGGGDVTLREDISGAENGVAYTVTTGAGDDNLNITLDGDAVDTIGESFALNAGNGNNTVVVSMVEGGVSRTTTANLDNLSITTGTGADSVTLIGGSDKATQVDTLTFTADTTDDGDETMSVSLDLDGDGTLETVVAVDLTGVDVTDANLVADTAYTAVVGDVDVAAAIVAGTVTISDPAGATNVFTVTYNDGLSHGVTATAVTANTTQDGLGASVTTADTQLSLDGDADFYITTGAESDFVYINSISDADSQDASKGTWNFGAVTGNQPFVDRVLYHATLTLEFAGFESTVTVATDANGNFIADQITINNAIKAAIDNAAVPEMAKLLSYADGTGEQYLTVTSNVEGENGLTITLTQPEVVATGATGTQVNLSTADITAMQNGLVTTGVAANSDAADTAAEIVTLMAGIDGNLQNTGVTGGTFATETAGNSADETAVTNVSVINVGTGSHDLVVLNSDDDSANTIEFTANWGGDNGKVSIVNFFTDGIAQATEGSHILDFTAILDTRTSASGSELSAVRVATTVNTNATIEANSITLDTSLTQAQYDALTESSLLADLNDAAGATTLFSHTNVATAAYNSTTYTALLMVESADNAGEYKVFELTVDESGAATTDFTGVDLLGTIDFGNSIDLANVQLA